MPSLRRLACVGFSALVLMGLTTPVLFFQRPARATVSYEILEPESWVGSELPVMDYIDVEKVLRRQICIALFYHDGCPDCGSAILYYEREKLLSKLRGIVQMVLIEVPPYGRDCQISSEGFIVGRLADIKDWFITTPTVVLLYEGKVMDAWEGKAPTVDIIYKSLELLKLAKKDGDSETQS